jgi:hypothetical protein
MMMTGMCADFEVEMMRRSAKIGFVPGCWRNGSGLAGVIAKSGRLFG